MSWDVGANRMLRYLLELAAVVAANAQGNSTVLVGVNGSAVERFQNFRCPKYR
jgi:hypothetical protein